MLCIRAVYEFQLMRSPEFNKNRPHDLLLDKCFQLGLSRKPCASIYPKAGSLFFASSTFFIYFIFFFFL